LIISIEHKKGEHAMIIGPNENIEVLVGIKHYESLSPKEIVFLVARRDTN